MKSSQLFSGLSLIMVLLVFGEGMLLGCVFKATARHTGKS
jgi:hypothetical protein